MAIDTRADAVFSEDRVQRLRKILWGVVVLGVVLALLAVQLLLTLVPDDERTIFAMMSSVVATVVLSTAILALRLLSVDSRGAKAASVVAGTALLVLALPMSVSWVGYLMALLGIAVLLLALLPDQVT